MGSHGFTLPRVVFSPSTLYFKTVVWSLTTRIKQWERNVVAIVYIVNCWPNSTRGFPLAVKCMHVYDFSLEKKKHKIYGWDTQQGKNDNEKKS